MDGKQLRAARRRMGWTQYWLADRLGVTRPSLAHWECGRARVPPRVAVAVRQAQKLVEKAIERLGGQL